MLRIIVPGGELFNEETNEFTEFDPVVLDLEHSLVSLSKWESKFQKPFLVGGEKSSEEVLGYVEAMVLTLDFPKEALTRLSNANLSEINDYIDSSQSATTFSDKASNSRGEIVTSELIYYWMIGFNIPIECENWHLNRLFALLKICSIKNSKEKKMSPQALAERNRKLNEERRKKLNSRG